MTKTEAETQKPAKASIAREYMIGTAALVLLAAAAAWGLMGDRLESSGYWPWAGENETAQQMIAAGPFQIAVTIEPETPRTGENRFLLTVQDEQGNPVAGATVRGLAESGPGADGEPAGSVPAAVEQTSSGVYQGKFDIPHEGDWVLAVDVERDANSHVDLVFDMSTGQRGLTLVKATPAGDVAYHTCSMHPSVREAKPGTCPICSMDLVPVTFAELNSGSIIVDEARRQAIGVKVGVVAREHFRIPIRLQGRVTYDENRLTDISLRFDGWIGQLAADFEGKSIRSGEILFTVYSPELLSLQEEYLETKKRAGGGTEWEDLISDARKRLKLWGLNESQIAWLEKRKKGQDYVPIFAPIDGTVIDKNIFNGSYFKKGERLLRMAELSRVWIETFAYESDLPLIEPDMSATVNLPNVGEDTFAAKVMQVDPFLGTGSRTARVRLSADNKAEKLKPGMFANVALYRDLGEVLLIPEDAVLVSGEKRIAFLDLGEGRLKPVEVTTGRSDGQRIEVRSGLSAGDKIVVSGNFLIASESKLKSGIDQW